jgi:hypothetical protein
MSNKNNTKQIPLLGDSQSKLSGGNLIEDYQVTRLTDSDKQRYTERCNHVDHEILSKGYIKERNIPNGFNKKGQCTFKPLWKVFVPGHGIEYYCYKHVPDTVKPIIEDLE